MLDRAEAGLELVREAALQAGLALSEDLSVVIDVGADKLFDQVHNNVCAYNVYTCIIMFLSTFEIHVSIVLYLCPVRLCCLFSISNVMAL